MKVLHFVGTDKTGRLCYIYMQIARATMKAVQRDTLKNTTNKSEYDSKRCSNTNMKAEKLKSEGTNQK